MREAELKTKFDEEVSAPFRERVWERLKKTGYVDDVCRGPSRWEEFEEEAVRLAEEQRTLLGLTKPRGKRPRGRKLRRDYHVDVELTELEAEHARAFTTYLVKRAAFLSEVRSFREKKLDGGTLHPEQVVTFLQSELETLPPKDYDALVSLDVNIARGHLSYGEEEELKDLVGGWENRGYVPWEEYADEASREGLKFDVMSIPTEPDPPYLYGLMHLVHDETGRTLEDVGRWVSSRSDWPIRDVAWFVLTGEPPETVSMEISIDAFSGMHKLVFAPWVSEKTIRRAYRRLQDSDNQPLRQKSLAAFRFVEEHTEPGQTPRWEELTQQWNERNPEDRFKDRSALRRAYKRAEKRFTFAWVNS